MLATLSLLIASHQASLSQNWQVTDTNTLNWNGNPYVPVGAHIAGNLQSIREADEAGVTDVLVDLPVDGKDWGIVIDALEKRGMRYMVTISTAAPTAETVVIEPESYRLPGLIGTVKLNLRLPGATSAYGILASQGTGTIRWEGLLPVEDGRLTFESDRDLTVDHVLVLYPVKDTNEVPDFWEKFDLYRDRLLQSLREHPFGPGYRGMINPFGKVKGFMPAQAQFIPTSPFFKIELEAYLKQKYQTLQVATTAWGLGVSRAGSIKDLTEIVPMWSESRGIEKAWDRKNNDSYQVDRENSAMWNDLRLVMYSSAVRRYQHLADNVRSITNGPVIQDWYGWGGPYENDDVRLDGISYPLQPDSVISAVDSTSRPLSSALRSASPKAVIASSIELKTDPQAPKVTSIITATRRMGVRGWFFKAKTLDQLTEIGQIHRLLATDETIGNWKPRGLFFPEAALNPATTVEISPGVWWLPAPGAGRFLDYGEGIEGYQYEEPGNRYLAIWSTGEPRIAKFRLIEPQDTTFETIDGSELETRVRRNEVEFMLPTRPVVIRNPIEIPVPMSSYEITTAMIDSLLLRFGSRIDIAGTARYEVSTAIRAFDRNPGAAFLDIRRQWRNLVVKSAPFIWLEAEQSPDNTFSAATTVPGASGDKVLSLSARIFRTDAQHYATFPLGRKVEGNHEVWIAGNIPLALIELLKVETAGGTYTVEPTKLSFYGAGLGWYRIGNVDLSDTSELKLVCPPGFPGELQVDCIVASPTPFRPSGSRPPTGWLLDFLRNQEPPRL